MEQGDGDEAQLVNGSDPLFFFSGRRASIDVTRWSTAIECFHDTHTPFLKWPRRRVRVARRKAQIGTNASGMREREKELRTTV